MVVAASHGLDAAVVMLSEQLADRIPPPEDNAPDRGT